MKKIFAIIMTALVLAGNSTAIKAEAADTKPTGVAALVEEAKFSLMNGADYHSVGWHKTTGEGVTFWFEKGKLTDIKISGTVEVWA